MKSGGRVSVYTRSEHSAQCKDLKARIETLDYVQSQYVELMDLLALRKLDNIINIIISVILP